MYIYICIYIYIYIVCTYNIYTYIHTCIYLSMLYSSICKYEYILTSIHMHSSTYIFIRVCIDMWEMHEYIQVSICMNIYKYPYAFFYIYFYPFFGRVIQSRSTPLYVRKKVRERKREYMNV